MNRFKAVTLIAAVLLFTGATLFIYTSLLTPETKITVTYTDGSVDVFTPFVNTTELFDSGNLFAEDKLVSGLLFERLQYDDYLQLRDNYFDLSAMLLAFGSGLAASTFLVAVKKRRVQQNS